MWVERITARAFGALRDQALELGPGMTVVYGPNEAGKTTWHAAIRMALTGVRRGRGSATKEAAALEDRHRPWDDPDRWAVEAIVHLADRRIDIVQDLAGKVACRATDLDLGVDVSAEITRPDGTPDASVWLGLDRDAFATTLSVSQGEMLAVSENAGALQEHMQRAAAAHGTDATAAGAIERLREYRKRAVGADTAVAKGPLRTAMRDLAAREDELADARRRHATYLEQRAAADAAADALAIAEQRLARARHADSVAAAAAARSRVDRATALAERHPAPPPELSVRDAQADAVAASLAAWQARPAVTATPVRSSAVIEAELAALPAPPEGDQQPDPSVMAAVRELDLAEEAERSAGARAPAVAPGPITTPVIPLAAAAGLLVAGLVALLAGAAIPSLVLGVAGLAVGVWAFATRRSPIQAVPPVDDTAAAAAARDSLAGALAARGTDPGPDLRGAVAAYLDACRQRSAIAASAASADALRRELTAARGAESLAMDARSRAAQAEAGLRRAWASVEPSAPADQPADEIVANLEAWQVQRLSEIAAVERAIREFEELTGLLGGRTLEALASEAASLERDAAALERTAGPASTEPIAPAGAAAAEVERLRAAAASLAGAVEVREADLLDVAAAEEAVAAARIRLERVTELAGLIDETLGLLEAAQRQVHRDLAPMLAAAIREWLPVISDGRYVEAGVNPADLSIEVKEGATGAWRQARLLSEGTREQIYLLLRIAMAQHLVTTSEVAPMLLDEVTGQSDAVRKVAVLDMLLALAAGRQLVLFTHDDDVLAWAERHLTAAPHRIIRLDVAARPAAGIGPAAVPVGSGT